MHKTQLSGRRYSCKSKISLVLVLLFLMGWATGVVSPPVQALSTTRAELNEAKERQSALSAERTRLAGISRQLDQERDELTGQLAWLNKRSDEQKALYREKTAQLEAAVSEMEQAYADYIAAEEDLASKQVQYSQRIQTMINYRPKSILEIFLGSRSLQGFFTTLQFMSIIADADQQMIEDLQASKDHAAMMRDIAKQHAADMEEVVKQLEAELAKLEADAAATKQDLEEIELKLSRQQQAEADLLAEAAMVAELVKTLQKKWPASRPRPRRKPRRQLGPRPRLRKRRFPARAGPGPIRRITQSIPLTVCAFIPFIAITACTPALTLAENMVIPLWRRGRVRCCWSAIL